MLVRPLTFLVVLSAKRTRAFADNPVCGEPPVTDAPNSEWMTLQSRGGCSANPGEGMIPNLVAQLTLKTMADSEHALSQLVQFVSNPQEAANFTELSSIDGVLPRVVSLMRGTYGWNWLQFSSEETMGNAMYIIARYAAIEEFREAVVRAGGLTNAVGLIIMAKTPRERAFAAATLSYLSAPPAAGAGQLSAVVDAMRKNEAFPYLARMFAEGSSEERLYARNAMIALGRSSVSRSSLINARVVEEQLKHLRGRDGAEEIDQALELLLVLASSDEASHRMIDELPVLVRLLKDARDVESTAVKRTIELLLRLERLQGARDEMVEADVISATVALLQLERRHRVLQETSSLGRGTSRPATEESPSWLPPYSLLERLAQGRAHLDRFRHSNAVQHFVSVIKSKESPIAQKGWAATVLVLLVEEQSRAQLRKAGLSAILLRLLHSGQVRQHGKSVLGLLMQLLIDPETTQVVNQKGLAKLVKLVQEDENVAHDLESFKQLEHIRKAVDDVARRV
mmetsp:Transcript_48897/g.104390  ORF Transcript_48897/g.104390 Transcript_48897/m.104390 type:complete len:511 (-) Transcript_48897:171-1703(-)